MIYNRFLVRSVLRSASLSMLIVASAVNAQTTSGTIERDGWNYDRSSALEFNSDDIDPAKEKAAHRSIAATGWIEFDLEIPNSGWYELWLKGAPADWSRDIYIDGKMIFRQSIAMPEDAGASGYQKECNLYINSGKHSLRIRRMGWPGQLPSWWKLIPAAGREEASLAVESISPQLIKPGYAAEIKIKGGTAGKSIKLELHAKSLIDGSLTSLDSIEFPAANNPVSKSVKIADLPKGAYVLQGSVNGKALRPNDLKAIPFAVTDVSAPAPEVPTPTTKFEVAGVYSSGIVVQRDVTLPVWGTSQPGSEIKVDFAGQSQVAKTDSDGKWMVKFQPIKEKGPFKLIVECGKQKISYDDILVGDVWLLSGQSNMGGRLREITNGLDVAKTDAKYPEVRLGWAALNPSADKSGYRFQCNWQSGEIGPKQNLDQFLAWNGIAWAFGTDLHKKLGIPIGLVINNRGGTFISTWVSHETMKNDPSFKASKKRWDDLAANDGIANFVASSLPSAINSARQKGAVDVDEIIRTKMDGPYRNVPGKNFEGLTKPLGPFPFKGVLWYQGESDSNVAYLYGGMLRAFMQEWRTLLGNQELPFVIVQIAYGKGQPWKGPPGNSRFGEQQLAQASVLETPNTSVATTYDLPTRIDDVHYKDKLPVGHRSALAALHDVYGFKDVIGYGPKYKSMQVNGNEIRISFDHLGKGLKIKGDKLGGFSIAGEDQKFVWADARIDGDMVVVSSDMVSKPVAVRYGWADSPCGANLYNSADLPAMVFRTDHWPLATQVLTEKQMAE